VIPIIFLLQKRYRESKTAMFWVGLCAIIGMSLNRVNVAGLATLSLTKSVYFPAWTEWVMTFGILSGAALFYLFCVEYFGLFDGLGRERVPDWITPAQFDHTDWKTLYFGGQRLGSAQLYSLVFILAAALSFGLVSDNAVFGIAPEKTPVENPRWIEASKIEGDSTATFVIGSDAGDPDPTGSRAPVMMLDGNRDGRYVLFDHKQHESRHKDEQSCALCHHMNKPYDRCTGCYQCHSDMYVTVNVFDHDLHTTKLGGNAHCSRCHADGGLPKLRENTTDCLECHRAMVQPGARVKPRAPRIETRTVGYMDALHGLCMGCHEETEKSQPESYAGLSRCTHCHQSLPDLGEPAWRQYLWTGASR